MMKRGDLSSAFLAIVVISPLQCSYAQSTQENGPPQSTASTLMVPTDTTIPLQAHEHYQLTDSPTGPGNLLRNHLPNHYAQ